MRRFTQQDDILGFCDGHSKLIFILRGQSPKDRFKAVVHELLHALEFEHDIKHFRHDLIYSLENPIVKLWIDNRLKPRRKR